MVQPEEAGRQEPDTLRILVVGDEVGTMDEVSTYLRRGGYDVTVARDGKSAQEALKPSPSVAVIDGHLPDMDGLDLIAKLQTVGPGIPIILITAWPNPVLYAQAMQQGAAACLSKPFSLWSFGIILHQVLRSTWMPGARPWQARQAFRASVKFPLIVHWSRSGQKLHGQLRDLSHTGAMVILPAQIEAGEAVTIEFGAPDQPVQLEACVVWNREDALHAGIFLHGLKFADPRPLEFAYEFARRLAPLPRRSGIEDAG
jgi:CheY-like chemotaxis protein